MKKKSTAVMATVLLFVFAFAAVVTVHSNVSANPPDYQCCQFRVCPDMTPAVFVYGLWLDGVCTDKPWPYYNPNDCVLDRPFCE
ncbi:MAG: hypothetical protein JSU74_05195 [Candidatus Zixiibacteriota bacterium]|nr:MAG: hypothetical protein JSU74_05195 [candidate division Zixibacteria bacterium]